MTRLALVTGGTTGIGAATCRALLAADYTVVANCVAETADTRRFAHDTGIAVHAWDVADAQACEWNVEQIVQHHGPIDVLVNNAGIVRDAMLHRMTPQQWRDVLSVDLDACFNMCRTVVPRMRERRYGRIINIGSVNGLSGQAGQTNYAAAKAGMIGFSKALALESASRGITVNVVAPGYTDTDMLATVPRDVLANIVATIPVGRLVRPEEIARGVVFLAAEAAAAITGTTLNINGGRYMA